MESKVDLGTALASQFRRDININIHINKYMWKINISNLPSSMKKTRFNDEVKKNNFDKIVK